MPNFVHNFAYRNLFPYFVNNSAVWWGTALQTGRLRVWFPMGH